MYMILNLQGFKSRGGDSIDRATVRTIGMRNKKIEYKIGWLHFEIEEIRKIQGDFPGSPVPVNVGDMGLISGPGRFHMPWSN